MVEIGTVLCPVDFSKLTEREVTLAGELCRRFGARLVLHHNLQAAPIGFSRAWDWNEMHERRVTEGSAERQLRELMAGLPEGVAAEAKISHGVVAPTVLYLARELPADLVVLGSHGWSTEDHTSVGEQIVTAAPCPVLTLHEGMERDGLRLDPEASPVPVLVPTDFSPGGSAAVRYALALRAVLPLRICLFHVLPGRRAGAVEDEARGRLLEAVPEELAEQVDCDLGSGPADETILEKAEALGAGLLVMGAHARGLLRGLLTRDTSQQILHRAPCPVWFVPEGFGVTPA
jgi:nucleotide-binding universal stress UspA family protein